MWEKVIRYFSCSQIFFFVGFPRDFSEKNLIDWHLTQIIIFCLHAWEELEEDKLKLDGVDVTMMGQQQQGEEEEEGVGGKDDSNNDFDGKELAEELLRIISSDFSLNELAFVPPWKHLRELLGEKFADEEEDKNDRKRLKLFYR